MYYIDSFYTDCSQFRQSYIHQSSTSCIHASEILKYNQQNCEIQLTKLDNSLTLCICFNASSHSQKVDSLSNPIHIFSSKVIQSKIVPTIISNELCNSFSIKTHAYTYFKSILACYNKFKLRTTFISNQLCYNEFKPMLYTLQIDRL